jgi:hypothetical protein
MFTRVERCEQAESIAISGRNQLTPAQELADERSFCLELRRSQHLLGR